MPFQATRTLTAFIMGDALKEAVKWSPSIFGSVKFGGMKMQFFSFILLCLDGYVKGAAIGYTFRDKYDLLVPMMVKPNKAREYEEHLRNLAQKRIDSYNQQITSIIDFVISTELARDKLTFDDFLKKAKTKVKIDSAGPRLKLIFEEATSFGVYYPEIVTRVISLQARNSSLDWETAKLSGLTFDINAQELDLKFLQKWARHNLREYCIECFPELKNSLSL